MSELCYKANFVNTGLFSQQFKYSDCVLPISIGQKYHEGDRLQAIVELVNKNFRSCTVIICDSLQRHTLGLLQDCTNEMAWNLALANGQRWLDEQRRVLSMLTIPNKVRFWNEWLASPEYQSKRVLIDQLYQESRVVRSAFEESIQIFIQRYYEKLSESSTLILKAKQLCLEYVKEECSIMPLWVTEGFHFEVYPSKRMPAMVAIYEHLVKSQYPNFLRWVRVNVRSKALAI